MTISGVVTGAATYKGFWMQDSDEDGIFVYLQGEKRGSLFTGAGFMPIYDGAPSLMATGKRVTVTGKVNEYYNMLQIYQPTHVAVIDDGPMPKPNVRKTGNFSGSERCDNATEAVEHTLVSVENAVITTSEDQYNHFEVDDGTGPVKVGNAMYRILRPGRASMGDTLVTLTGVLSYEFGYYEINPRDPGDVGGIRYTSGDAPKLNFPAMAISEATKHSVTKSEKSVCSDFAAEYEGKIVTVSGVVTGIDKQPIRANGVLTGYKTIGYYIQEGTKPFGGLRVYLLSYELTPMKTSQGFLPEVGNFISVTGKIEEYYGATNMVDVVASSIISDKGEMPKPLKVNTGRFTGENKCDGTNEPYEGMLVTFHNVKVTSPPNQYGEFYVDDGSGPVQVEDENVEVYIRKGLKVNDTITSLTGVVDFAFGRWELHLRDDNDVGPFGFLMSPPPPMAPPPPKPTTETVLRSTISLSGVAVVDGFSDAELTQVIDAYAEATSIASAAIAAEPIYFVSASAIVRGVNENDLATAKVLAAVASVSKVARGTVKLDAVGTAPAASAAAVGRRQRRLQQATTNWRIDYTITIAADTGKMLAVKAYLVDAAATGLLLLEIVNAGVPANAADGTAPVVKADVLITVTPSKAGISAEQAKEMAAKATRTSIASALPQDISVTAVGVAEVDVPVAAAAGSGGSGAGVDDAEHQRMLTGLAAGIAVSVVLAVVVAVLVYRRTRRRTTLEVIKSTVTRDIDTVSSPRSRAARAGKEGRDDVLPEVA